MTIELYERAKRLKEYAYRNPFRCIGTVGGFALGMYVVKDTDNFLFIVAGVFLPAFLGNMLGGYIGARLRR